MKVKVTRPVFDRDEYYESSSRSIRWICLVLVLVSYPFDSEYGLVVMTTVVLTAIYNALRYSRSLLRRAFFNSRVNSLAIDHIVILALVALSGGLESPYYPFFFLLILAVIASYGIAGFAFSLSAQLVVTLLLLKVQLPSASIPTEFQFIIKLVFLVVFSLIAEQAVRSRDEEYLLENRFTHRIENERQRLLSLINSLSNAVLAVDGTGKVYLYNAAALELLNTNRDIAGASINDLLPLTNKAGAKVNLLRLIKADDHPVNRQDLYFRAADGSKLILDLTVSPVHIFGFGSDNRGGYMAVFRDITKQKTLDEERDEFISVTSHELRTPLAIAEANLSTAMMPGFGRMDTKAKNLVSQAYDNIVFLGQLIQDLTTLSKAERSDLKLKLEIVDTTALAEQLLQNYRSQAAAKGLKFELKLDPNVKSLVTSEHELREILQNFIVNAIKYTETGGITLEITHTDAGTDFAIHDTGIGISATDKSKIFTKFYRSEDYRTRKTGGTGLGLYITHKLAEKLGMHISFSSRLNHGSTFRVLVPNHVATSKAQAITTLAQADTGQSPIPAPTTGESA